jgi:hypothetical protein
MPYIGKSPSGLGVRTRYLYTATASQTTFSGADTQNLTLSYSDSNFIDVHQNGVLLKIVDDYTATSGTSVVLGTGATADDVIEITVYDIFSVANHVKKSGDIMTGGLEVTTGGVTVTGDSSVTGDLTVTGNNQLKIETSTATKVGLLIESTSTTAADGPRMSMYRNSASPADNDDIGQIQFNGQNSAGEKIMYASIFAEIDDVTDGTENGAIVFNLEDDGALNRMVQIGTDETVFNTNGLNIDFRVESDDNTHMIFVDAGNDRVGIGTSSPSTELHLKTTTQGDIVTFESTNAGALTGPNLLLYRNSSSPADNDNIGAIRFRGRNDNSEDVDYAEIESLIVDASDGTEDGTLAFRTVSGGTSTEQMRITSSGFVGIGESSPLSRLHVADGNVLFENTTTNVNSTVHHYTNSVSGGAYRVRFDSNDTVVGSIGVGTSSTAFNTSSDYRLKENVVTDWDATTRLKQLKPSRFNFILDADTTVDGFLAHEVSSIVPEAITGEKDAVDAEGNPEYQSIDQSKLVPLLTKALQEAMARIETLEAKVTALESK